MEADEKHQKTWGIVAEQQKSKRNTLESKEKQRKPGNQLTMIVRWRKTSLVEQMYDKPCPPRVTENRMHFWCSGCGAPSPSGTHGAREAKQTFENHLQLTLARHNTPSNAYQDGEWS